MSEHDPRDDYDDELWKGRLAPQDIVRWPASIMWVFGLLQLIIAQVWFAVLCYVFLMAAFDERKTLQGVWNDAIRQEEIWLTVLCWPVATACTILVMRAANDLKRFRRYPWVVAGAVLTVLSVPFIYLGVIQVPL